MSERGPIKFDVRDELSATRGSLYHRKTNGGHTRVWWESEAKFRKFSPLYTQEAMGIVKRQLRRQLRQLSTPEDSAR